MTDEHRMEQLSRAYALAIAAVTGVVALLLFVWPSLPFAKFLPLPDLGKMLGFKKDAPPPAAGQPAAAPAPTPAPAH